MSFTSVAKQSEATKKDIQHARKLLADQILCSATIATESKRPYSAIFFRSVWDLQLKKQKIRAQQQSEKQERQNTKPLV